LTAENLELNRTPAETARNAQSEIINSKPTVERRRLFRKLLTLAGLGLTGALLSQQNTGFLPAVNADTSDGSVAFYSGGNTTGDNSQFYWSNSAHQLGIGTGSPLTTLDVVGNAEVVDSGGTLAATIYETAGTGDALHAVVNGSGIAGYFKQLGGIRGGMPPLLVAAANGQYLNAVFQNISGGSPSGGTDNSVLVQWVTGDSTPVKWNVGVGGANNGFGLTQGQFYFENPIGTVRFLIDNLGRVGIGTTSPAAALSFGTAVTTNKLFLYDGFSDKYGFGIAPSLLQIYAGAAFNSDIAFGNYDGTTFTEHVRYKGNGKVGIGTTTPQTTLQVNGGVSAKISTQAGNYTMTTSDFAILANASSGALTVTLPPASNAGMLAFIKKIDATTNAVTISRSGTDTIEAANTVKLTRKNQSRTLIAGGGSPGTWYIQSSAT
jgi:hypothetical protein